MDPLINGGSVVAWCYSCNSSNGLYGSFSCDGYGITFFICNSSNYAIFQKNTSSLPPKFYDLFNNQSSGNWTFIVPSTDKWYFVLSNAYSNSDKQCHIDIYQAVTGPTITIDSPFSFSGFPTYEAGQSVFVLCFASDLHFDVNSINVSATDSNGHPVLLNGASYYYIYGYGISFAWDTESNLSSGYYTLTFCATDILGNPTTVNDLIWIYAEPAINQPSAITFTAGTTGNTITWQASSVLASYYTIVVDGTNEGNYTWSRGTGNITWNIDNLGVGTHNVTCTVHDVNGYSATSSVQVTVKQGSLPYYFIAGIGVFLDIVLFAVVMLTRRRHKTIAATRRNK
jgi:hypothetical protein